MDDTEEVDEDEDEVDEVVVEEETPRGAVVDDDDDDEDDAAAPFTPALVDGADALSPSTRSADATRGAENDTIGTVLSTEALNLLSSTSNPNLEKLKMKKSPSKIFCVKNINLETARRSRGFLPVRVKVSKQ